MVVAQGAEVIGLPRHGNQLQRFAKLAAPPIAHHLQAPPSPIPTAKKCAAFRNAAAPYHGR